MRTYEQLNQVRLTVAEMDSGVFVFIKKFSISFSSHDFSQLLLETMKVSSIYNVQGARSSSCLGEEKSPFGLQTYCLVG